jgi:hypothetical protein
MTVISDTDEVPIYAMTAIPEAARQYKGCVEADKT